VQLVELALGRIEGKSGFHRAGPRAVDLDLGELLGMLPGMGNIKALTENKPDDKQLARIEAITHSFSGFYQVERYIMAHPEQDETGSTPLTQIAIRSLITTPEDDATLPRGRQAIRGLAWSGAAPLSRVEVSVDGGATWETAAWTSDPARYAWRSWEYDWRAERPGEVAIQCRATDEAGNTQPTEPLWNRLGYANSAIQTVHVSIT
jgi:hypothetical protein